MKTLGNSPIIILFTVNIPIPAKTRNVPFQRVPTLTTLQTRGMPPPVHRLQVKPVRNPRSTTRTHGTARAVLVRVAGGGSWRRARVLDRLQLGDVVLEGGMGTA